MVVGDVIAILADDDTRSAALALTALGLCEVVAEEETEERIVDLGGLVGLSDRDLYIYYCFHCTLCSIREVWIVAVLVL